MYCHAPCEKSASTHSHSETGVMSVRSFIFDPQQTQRISPLASMSRPALRPIQPPVQLAPVGGGSFPRVKRGRGVTLTRDPHLVSRTRMRSYTPLPLGVCMAVAGQLYFYFTYLCPYISVVSVGRVLISAPPPPEDRLFQRLFYPCDRISATRH
jgi:hypothetical protein